MNYSLQFVLGLVATRINRQCSIRLRAGIVWHPLKLDIPFLLAHLLERRCHRTVVEYFMTSLISSYVYIYYSICHTCPSSINESITEQPEGPFRNASLSTKVKEKLTILRQTTTTKEKNQAFSTKAGKLSPKTQVRRAGPHTMTKVAAPRCKSSGLC